MTTTTEETISENWLSTKEVAESLGVSLRRVQQLIKSGRLPARQFGRDWLVNPVDFAQFKPKPRGRPATSPPPSVPPTPGSTQEEQSTEKDTQASSLPSVIEET